MKNNFRLGKLFNTKNNKYFYDSGTGRVLQISDSESRILNEVLNSNFDIDEISAKNNDLYEFIKRNNLLSRSRELEFIIPTKEEFKRNLIGNCKQVIIELTEDCNLRCSYCIYNKYHPNFRGYSNKAIKIEKIFKTISYLLDNYHSDEFYLSFYGGEPLMEFDNMKKTIDYCLKKYNKIKFHISFTTNLTLLTDRMLDYFINIPVKGISILCSIDGTKDIHDRYRKFKDNYGSYNIAMENFIKLKNRFHELENKNLSINCVISPPYNREKIDYIDKFFKDNLKVGEEIPITYSYADMGTDDNFIPDNDITPIENWEINKISEDNYYKLSFLTSKTLFRINNRRIGDVEKTKNIFLHGNCIHGQRRLFLSVNGEFKICERTGNAISLGNYLNGYNIDKIYEKYYLDYVKYFKNICNECWACDLCDICYEKVFDEEGIINGIEKRICPQVRKLINNDFINYFEILENNPKLINDVISKIKMI